MKVIDKTNTEHYTWGNHSDGWHLLNTEGLSVIEERVPSGGEEKLHYHRLAQQFFYVLSGTALIEIEGIQFKVNTGSGIHIASGKCHRLINQGEEDLRFLVISQPRSHGDRVDV